MPIPNATPEDILAAMELFDTELRNTEGWRGWETKGNYKFAISYYDSRYPVKQIVAQASGIGTHEFSGGEEANNWLSRRGFKVIQLHDEPTKHIRDLGLPTERVESNAAAAIRAAVARMYPDPEHRKAAIELVADAIERAQHISPASWAVSLPVSTDQKSQDLCFNVLWTQPAVLRNGELLLVFDRNILGEDANASLEATMVDTRNGPTYPSVTDASPFRAYISTDQFNTLPLLRDAYLSFVEGCAERVKSRVHRFQEHVPAIVDYLNEELGRDLPQPDYGVSPTTSDQIWLFQANPVYWNLAETLKDCVVGDKDTWTVSRFRAEMGPGQLVILWQSGHDAGIHALGELIDAPSVRPTSEFWPDRAERLATEWAVPFQYTLIMDPPILRSTLLNHPVLKDLAVIRGPQGTNYKVSPEQWDALQEFIPTPVLVQPTIDDLAGLTHLEHKDLEELEELLLDKRQLVLEGPPGSGKTFLAEHFARYFAGLPLNGAEDERVETVQFHQSYGYEDFVQGIRPVTTEQGQLQYHVVPGIFLRMCDLASRNPDQRFVLIIDEINRGNLSRIFGELLLLLEYREKRVRLPYGALEGQDGHTYLTIPKNLYLIGTMNSTDRSLALIDYALRRRFYFYPLLPVVNGQAPVLARWLAKQGFAEVDQTLVLRMFTQLNRVIEEHFSSEYQVGHSYFMRADIHTELGRTRVWQRAILPLLEEYLHGVRSRESVLAELTLERLLADPAVTLAHDAFDPGQL